MGLAAVVLFLVAVLDAQQSDPYRTVFHFQPLKNWMNDPNGPVYINGYYHLFYQYNPTAPVWGDMHWGHAVSKDCVRWIQLPIALSPDKPYDSGGCFSGSMTIVDGVPIISYSVASDQLQCLALPANVSDPFLVQWVKPSYNPIIPSRPMAGLTGFRDDTTAWVGADGLWHMLVGSGTSAGGGVLLYTSKDFVTWSFDTMMHQTAVGVSSGASTMWECPDFYPLPTDTTLWVLKASTGGRDWYAVGTYDEAQTFVPLSSEIGYNSQLYDFGQFYASKTFYDSSTNRQILFGWVAEMDTSGPSRGWQSIQSFPRSVDVDPTDTTRLIFNPIVEIETLRQSHLSLTNVTIPPGGRIPLPLSGNQLDIIAVFQLPGNVSTAADYGIQVLASPTLNEVTTIAVGTAAATYLEQTDRPGGDYYLNNTFGMDNHDPQTCLALCNMDSNCRAWTFVFPGYSGPNSPARCCLKSAIPAPKPGSPCCTSGTVGGSFVNNDLTQSTLATDAEKVIQWAPLFVRRGESTVTLRVVVDHSVVETYSQGGRTVTTSRVYPTLSASTGTALFNAGPTAVQLLSLDMWEMAAAVPPTMEELLEN